MNLLTDAQIKDANKDDLVATLRAINQHLDSLDEDTVLVVTREILTEHGVADALRITFGVDEWDNGYFYAGVQNVENAWGNEVELSEAILDALSAALHGPLTQLGYDGPRLGRFDSISIDLASHTLVT